MNSITMQLQADKLIRMALEEDITSEDVSTNAVMPTNVKGTVDLIAKEDGVIAGMEYMPEFLSFWMKVWRLRCSVRTAMRLKKVI